MKKIYYIHKERSDAFMEGRITNFSGMILTFDSRPLALKHLLKEVKVEDNWIYTIVEGYISEIE